MVSQAGPLCPRHVEAGQGQGRSVAPCFFVKKRRIEVFSCVAVCPRSLSGESCRSLMGPSKSKRSTCQSGAGLVPKAGLAFDPLQNG